MTAPAPTARRRGRGRAAALLLVLAGLTAVVAVPTWFTTTGTDPLRGTVSVEVSGTQVAPAVVAGAVVILAAVAAVGLVGRIGRWFVALVVVAVGVLVVATTLGVTTDPVAAVTPSVAAQTGVGRLDGPVTTTVWPWAALAVGVLDVVAGAWFAAASRTWSGPSRRHETGPAASAAPTGQAPDERSDWDALSRGDDPS
ncbi:Trp biosynthesis-associated membrane protein [Cellulomonas fengjieae]|uniref:Trp biosynthesis-associated membrane protein n=1 Tax=Cellulomonas fengjieae TaxID=2819978 RepID=UPI001AAFDB70|nr:Trp biosynthesis-associated membrane protein [Cellulomonas fengjieae]MBO3102942.1 Trp biosynthesis-associated membrane protein [Cellulomonas fengjieae]